MKRLEEIDPNFVIDETMPAEARFFDAREAMLCGLCEGEFRRLPAALIPDCNEGVQELAYHTAGGRVRFRTNSKYLCVAARLREVSRMTHMPLSGSSSFELWCDDMAIAPHVYRAGWEQDAVQGCFPLPEGEHDYALYLPLYNGVNELLIGLSPDATFTEPRGKERPPITFYGSSITQGGCASRPSSCYTAIVCRRLGADMRNLGFSGSGRGEENMAAHIATLPMSAFVMDYDHNAPDVAHLERTHKRFFDIVRAAQPDLPIVLVSKPDFDNNPAESDARRAVIERTYRAALAVGDTRVRFVDGQTLFGKTDREICTMDGCHPNDLGFMRMADAIAPVVRELL